MRTRLTPRPSAPLAADLESPDSAIGEKAGEALAGNLDELDLGAGSKL